MRESSGERIGRRRRRDSEVLVSKELWEEQRSREKDRKSWVRVNEGKGRERNKDGAGK